MSLSPLSRHPAAFAACLALSLALAPLAYADPAAVALPSFAPIVKQVMPAVVNISVTEQASAIASGACFAVIVLNQPEMNRNVAANEEEGNARFLPSASEPASLVE